MAGSSEEFSAEMQRLLKEELALVKKRLDELQNGQATMTSVLRKIHENSSSAGDIDQAVAVKGYNAASVVPVTPRVEGQLCAATGPSTSKLQAMPLDQKDSAKNFSGEAPVKVSASQEAARGHTSSTQSMSLAELAEDRREHEKHDLYTLIALNDDQKRRESALNRYMGHASLLDKWRMTDMSKKDLIVDSIVALIITANAIFIGISADNWDGEIDVYMYVDVVFSVLFLLELVFHIRLHTFHEQFYGKDKWANRFDALLVTLDLIQLFIVFVTRDLAEKMQESGVPSASLFRIVRLLRVTRVLRLLRHPSFDSLLQMIESIVEGATTLAWAIVLFGIIIYIVALLSRELLGEKEQHQEIHPYFNSVPRSMLTVFRCSFGDCSTTGGTPISEFIDIHYGAGFSVFYSLFLFFVAIGLFNVISAIFVNTTLARTEENKERKLQERFQDEKLFATRVCTVIRRCLFKRDDDEALLSKHAHIDHSMLEEDLPRDVVDDVCQNDEEAKQALGDLDIDPHDYDKLADILDPDHSGLIGFSELIIGLRRMRGVPRRSDIVTVDLMTRSAQAKLDEILTAVMDNNECCTEMRIALLKLLGGTTVL